MENHSGSRVMVMWAANWVLGCTSTYHQMNVKNVFGTITHLVTMECSVSSKSYRVVILFTTINYITDMLYIKNARILKQPSHRQDFRSPLPSSFLSSPSSPVGPFPLCKPDNKGHMIHHITRLYDHVSCVSSKVGAKFRLQQC